MRTVPAFEVFVCSFFCWFSADSLSTFPSGVVAHTRLTTSMRDITEVFNQFRAQKLLHRNRSFFLTISECLYANLQQKSY